MMIIKLMQNLCCNLEGNVLILKIHKECAITELKKCAKEQCEPAHGRKGGRRLEGNIPLPQQALYGGSCVPPTREEKYIYGTWNGSSVAYCHHSAHPAHDHEAQDERRRGDVYCFFVYGRHQWCGLAAHC